MKKIILISVAVLMSAVSVFAQDLSQATEKAKAAKEAYEAGDVATALASFKEALTLAEACGDEGQDIVATCKSVIPSLVLSNAKSLIKEEKYDDAVAELKSAASVAKEYQADEIAAEAESLVSDVYMQKGNTLINAKDFAGAAEAYGKVLEADPANGKAALRQGQAYANAGKIAEAEQALGIAAANGEEAAANKQLSNIYLKKASAELKNKSFAAAAAAAEKSNSYMENANAYKIAGNAYSQLKKNSEAIKNLKKYIELSPDAKDANQVCYTIAALAQQSGDKATAIAYYKKVANDPKFGETAKAQIAALSK